MTTFDLNSIQVAKPIERTCIYECKTWKVFFSQKGKITFIYNKQPDKEKVIGYQMEIDSLQQTLWNLDLYEKQSVEHQIRELERNIEYELREYRFWRYYTYLDSISQVKEFQELLQDSREPQNIWSCLFNTWLKFGNSKDRNNLTKNLTDSQLDNLTAEEATSIVEGGYEKYYPRTREEEA